MGNPPKASRTRRLVKVAAGTLVVLIILGAAIYGVMWGIAASKKGPVEKRWAAAGMPLQGYLERLPKTEENAAAKRLVELTAKLGFSVKTRGSEPNPEESKDWLAVKAAVKEAIENNLDTPTPTGPPIPEAVASYLDAHEADIIAIREHLLAEKIVWISHPGEGLGSPIPNLLGQIELSRVLVAHALLCHQRSQDAMAVADLEALWKLGDALNESPIMISQLILIAERNLTVVALRKLEGDPAPWLERIKGYDPAPSMVQAWRNEMAGLVWAYESPVSKMGLWQESTLVNKGMAVYRKPFLRLCISNIGNIFLDNVQALQAAGPCASDDEIKRFGAEARKRIPKWNYLAQDMFYVNITDSWGRIKYLKLQLELTQKVLELKALKAQAGAWPKEAPGIEKSFCPKEKWVYLAMEGGFSLKYSGPPSSKEMMKHPFPLEFLEGSAESKP